MKVRWKKPALLSGKHLEAAVLASFLRLAPRYQIGNPVMFVVYTGAIFITAAFVFFHADLQGEPLWFTVAVVFCLWFTVLFANFAESVAEGKGRAQAESLKKARRDITAKRIFNIKERNNYEMMPASLLRQGDLVLVEAGDLIPGDGKVIDGIAAVDESAITGESAPVIRESDSDRDAVTGGTRVLSDWLVISVSADPGESFLDRMIAMVEGTHRQKTPNEVALGIFLSAMTIIFLVICITLFPFIQFSSALAEKEIVASVTVLTALLVSLSPTTIGGLLSAIGIAGMNRLIIANVIAKSGRAIEAAGDVSVLLLDKTGTVTLGNRQATAFIPAKGVTLLQIAAMATIASLADETPEGKSIVALARSRYGISEHEQLPHEAVPIPFSAETRMSGIRIMNRYILKGSEDAIENHLKKFGASIPNEVKKSVEAIAREGGTPLIVVDGSKVLGVIYLKDIVKPGIKQRLAELRAMGIKSVMITGDNPITAAAIALEAGADDFIAQATPEAKLRYIREMQEKGEIIAMVGDGTNDAPALAQADVAVAMNNGTQAAKEAGNMVDLDSNPTKLIEIVQIGKQLLMTRGSLATFSLVNDVAKYFAIIPAIFVGVYPSLESLNLMKLSTPHSAILSTVVFNALIIVLMIPLALKGVSYKPAPASRLLLRNILIYGCGGLIAPFIGIKIIDSTLHFLGIV